MIQTFQSYYCTYMKNSNVMYTLCKRQMSCKFTLPINKHDKLEQIINTLKFENFSVSFKTFSSRLILLSLKLKCGKSLDWVLERGSNVYISYFVLFFWLIENIRFSKEVTLALAMCIFTFNDYILRVRNTSQYIFCWYLQNK